MALEEQKRTIGEFDVRSQPLPAMKGYALIPRIAKLVGPMLSATVARGASILTIASVIEAFGSLSSDEAQSLAAALLAETIVVQDGKSYELKNPASINFLFTGKLLSFVQVQQFALEVNFADFFAAFSTTTTSESSSPPPGSP